MKTQVFEQHHTASRRSGANRIRRDVADTVVGEHHGHAEELRQAIDERPQAEFRSWLALRASKMARQNYSRRALIERVLDRRQRRANARVVADDAVFQRHVEVDANEDALTLQGEIFNRQLRHGMPDSVL